MLESAGTYVDCYRFRGDILNGRGDWAGAQKAYAEAVALAPDLPASYYSWGLALAGHADLPGAEAKFKDANKRGPHWADPLKAWGDVLTKEGRGREALIKYGADPNMLVAKGYGEADPIASNDSAEGRLRNRRIEYHVLKAPT